MKRTYTAELKSGFELSIEAENLKEAKAYASRAARGNDKVVSVKLYRADKEERRGGSRPGAGRPKGEPTKTLSYRVPEKHYDEIDHKCRSVIERVVNGQNLSQSKK